MLNHRSWRILTSKNSEAADATGARLRHCRFTLVTLVGATLSLTSGFLLFSQVRAADADPTVAQIYQAFRAGRIAEAQGMLDHVLRDHPDSAKAHFVQAEIDAAEGHRDLARSELARAEQLKPGLPDVKPRTVKELKEKLGLPAD